MGGGLAEAIKPKVEAWGVPLKSIYENAGVRLDASHYDRQTASALQELKNSRHPLERLSDIADVNLPGQFVRIWATSKEYGVPYVNATDLMSIAAIGSIGEKTRYLSRVTNVDFDELIIRSDTLVVTCSGTIGRVFYIPESLDGCAATHDLVRVVPSAKVPVGFLHAYLSSALAQSQIMGYTHGGQIDHVTDEQVGSVLVPMLPDAQMKKIHRRTIEALHAREAAMLSLSEVAKELKATLH